MINSKLREGLAKQFAVIRDPKEMDEFLQRILTPAEYDEISQRLQIFKKLRAGMPQRKIAAELGVSIGTISRGAREFKYSGTDFSKFLI